MENVQCVVRQRVRLTMTVPSSSIVVAYITMKKHARGIVLVKLVHLTKTVEQAKHAAIRMAAKNVPVPVLQEIVQRMKIVQLASTVVARTTNARRIVSRNFVLLMNTARQANRAVVLSKNAW